jgi:hypothetical protein
VTLVPGRTSKQRIKDIKWMIKQKAKAERIKNANIIQAVQSINNGTTAAA